MADMQRVLYTVGHSNRDLESFVRLLKAHDIRALADIRSMPGSRRLPHFNAESLAVALPGAGIDYYPFKSLGGRRKVVAGSVNNGWRVAAFQAYADYMGTEEFKAGMKELLNLAAPQRLVIMCAEAVPWRCHRNLVADAATRLHGWEVRHIMTDAKADRHRPLEFGRVEGDNLVYPADDLFAED